MEHKKYWIKLEKDFLNSSQIKVIKNMPNGKDYIIFYLALMLESTNTEGHLRFSELVPYNEEMLASVTDMNVDIVRSAMTIFQNLGLIQILENGTIFLPDVPNRVGKESESAERVRLFREREKQKMLQCNADVTGCNDNKDKDKDKDKKIEHIKCIVSYLNEITNSNYKPTTEKTQTLIKARLNEGFTIDDFKKVIDNMFNSWRDTEWEQYLRPETLFGTKFESYLNKKVFKDKKGFMEHDYMKSDLNKLYNNLDDIEI